MKSRSFSAALFAAFVLVSFLFTIPSASAGSDPTPSQCRRIQEDWSIYRSVGNAHLFPKRDRALLDKCYAMTAKNRNRAQAVRQSAPGSNAFLDRIFR